MAFAMFEDREPVRRRSVTPNAALNFQTEAAFQLAQASPLVAVRTLVRGLRQQSRGGQLSACRELLSAVIGNDTYLRDEVIAELKKLPVKD
jgi:hypothetical protein